MSIEIPERYGGAAAGFFSSIVAIEELAKVDSCMGGLVDLQNTVVNTLLLHHGLEHHHQRYLPMFAKDTVIHPSIVYFNFSINQS